MAASELLHRPSPHPSDHALLELSATSLTSRASLSGSTGVGNLCAGCALAHWCPLGLRGSDDGHALGSLDDIPAHSSFLMSTAASCGARLTMNASRLGYASFPDPRP